MTQLTELQSLYVNTVLSNAFCDLDSQEVEKGSAWRVSADDGGAEFADYDPYYQEYDDVEEVGRHNCTCRLDDSQF